MLGIFVSGKVCKNVGIFVGVIINWLLGLFMLEVILVRNFIGVMFVDVVSCSLLKIVWWIFWVMRVVELW